MLRAAMSWFPTLTPRRRRQLWYVPALALAMGLTMLRLLLMAHLLDVPAFASYSAGLLISSTFCMVSCLGLQSVLQREWPVNLVRGQRRRAAVRAAQCCVWMVVTAMVVIPIAWLGPAVPVMTPPLAGLGVVHGVAQQAFLVASTGSRSEGNALVYSVHQLARAGLALAGSVAVAAWFGQPLLALGVEALVSAASAFALLNVAFRHAKLAWRACVVLATRRIRAIPWRASLTSMAVLLAVFAILNADRWMAARFLAPDAFAQYSFVAILLAVAQATQALINASVYPLLARRFAHDGEAAVFRICLRASLGLGALGLLASLPFIILSQRAIAAWYPSYADASQLVPLMTLVGVLRISDFFSSYLMITGREARMLQVNLVTLLCGVGAWFAWLEPLGDPPLTLQDVATLAAVLSLLGGVIAAAISWTVRRKSDSPDSVT